MKPIRIQFFFVLLLQFAALMSQLMAQQPPEPEAVTVTVSAEAVPVEVAAAAVTVIDRERIENSGGRSVVDVLRTAPGLHVTQAGGRGGLANVMVRGAEASFTLVMIDGIPVNDITSQTGGDYDFSSLSLDNVERIEIVRGPLSSLYGSEATGGVINIISRQGNSQSQVRLEGDLGNFGSGQIGGSVSGKKGAFDYSAAASYFSIDEQTEGDSLSLGTVSANIGLTMGDNKVFRLQSRFADSFSTGFPENGGGPGYSVLRLVKETDSQELILGTRFEHEAADYWNYSLSLDYFSRSQDQATPPIWDSVPPSQRSQPSIEADGRFERLRTSFSNNWSVAGRWTVSSLFQVRHERGWRDAVIADVIPSDFELNRTTVAAGGEVLYRTDRLTGSVGLRVDKSADFEAEASPRVGLNYLLSEAGIRIKASWGEGFKMPSFFALAEPNVGNPNLRPETTRGFDAGVELHRPRIFGSLVYFHNRFEDLIDFSPELFRLVNRASVVGQGAEAEFRLRATSDWGLDLHARYLNLENRDSTEQLRDRPRWRGGFGMEGTPWRSGFVRIENLWVGPRYDFQLPVPERDVAGGYSLSRVTFRQQLTPQIAVFSSIENLLNNKYEEFVGFRNPGIHWRVGLRFRLEP